MSDKPSRRRTPAAEQTTTPEGTETVPAAAATALGMALVVNLGDTGQLTLQTHLDRDETPAAKAQLIDVLYGLAARARRHARADVIESEIKALQENIAFGIDNLARAEADHAAKAERRASEIAQAQEDDQQQFLQGQKRGEYKPSQAALQRVRALRNEQQKDDDLRAQTIKGHQQNVEAAQLKIGKLEQERAEIQAIIDGAYR